MQYKAGIGLTALLALISTPLSMVYAEPPASLDFLNMNLRDLADQEVTSVSRKKEKASEAAAAIYVISPETIRRSGARHLPELLRHVPGIQVARAGSSQWAISARGFNDQFANKLLVMIDGRTLYSPNFSGVWWDIQMPILDDVERIEVIRGPGGSVWGANAVNGVVNIITKSAEDTQGSLAVVGAGNQERVNTQLRHGFKMGEHVHTRLYAAYQKNAEVERASGADHRDEWDHKTAGFRVDIDHLDDSQLMLQGGVYQGVIDQQYFAPITTAPFTQSINDQQEVYGANMLARWEHDVSEQSSISLQGFVDYHWRDITFVEIEDVTLDLNFQHTYNFGQDRTFNWGLGYRTVADDFNGGFALDMQPDSRTRHYYSGFVQYTTPVLRDDLHLTLGSKIEHNPFSHGDVQPSARLAWLIDDSQTLWGSVSRAIRTPDRSGHDIMNVVATNGSPFGTNAIVRMGHNEVDTEKLTAYELGYRIQPRDDVAIDISTFYNDYDDLLINIRGTPSRINTGFGAPYNLIPITLQNVGNGSSYGAEILANWQVNDAWSLEANYSYINIDIDNQLSSTVNTEFKTPEHQFGVHSYVDLPHNIEWDQHLYYNDHVGVPAGGRIDDYLRLDMRVGFEPMDGVEVSVSGENLLDSSHPEFGPFLYNAPAEIGRTFYGQVKVRF